MYLILGSIGSGKTEIAKRLLVLKDFNVDIYIGSDAYKYMFFNDDEMRQLGKVGYRCADELAFIEMKKACLQGKSFMYELCPTNRNKIESIKNLIEGYAYRSVGFFVGTNNVSINIERVAHRTSQGGKDYVSPEKIRSRYIDAMGRVLELMHITDTLYFVDNSGSINQSQMKIVGKHQKGIIEVYDDNDCCAWFQNIQDRLN